MPFTLIHAPPSLKSLIASTGGANMDNFPPDTTTTDKTPRRGDVTHAIHVSPVAAMWPRWRVSHGRQHRSGSPALSDGAQLSWWTSPCAECDESRPSSRALVRVSPTAFMASCWLSATTYLPTLAMYIRCRAPPRFAHEHSQPRFQPAQEPARPLSCH